MTDLVDGWRCAGCGVSSPDRKRSCDCPTNVVWKGSETAWKLDQADEAATELAALRERVKEADQACQRLCGEHGFATGHGDSVADMIDEISVQLKARAETAERKQDNLLAVIEAETNGDRATVNEQNAFEHFTRLNKSLVAIRSAARAIMEE